MQIIGLDRQPLRGNPLDTRTFIYSFTFHDSLPTSCADESRPKIPHAVVEKTVTGMIIQVPTEQLQRVIATSVGHPIQQILQILHAQSRGGIPPQSMELLGIPIGPPQPDPLIAEATRMIQQLRARGLTQEQLRTIIG